MRKFFQSLLAFFTLGVFTMGCSKSDAPPPPAPTDVVLNLPGMF